MPTGDFISSEGLTDFLSDMFNALELIAFSLTVGGIAWAWIVLRAPRGFRRENILAVMWCIRLILIGAVILAADHIFQLAIQAFALSRTLGESPFPRSFTPGNSKPDSSKRPSLRGLR